VSFQAARHFEFVFFFGKHIIDGRFCNMIMEDIGTEKGLILSF